jgi:hypothetical protein
MSHRIQLRTHRDALPAPGIAGHWFWYEGKAYVIVDEPTLEREDIDVRTPVDCSEQLVYVVEPIENAAPEMELKDSELLADLLSAWDESGVG